MSRAKAVRWTVLLHSSDAAGASGVTLSRNVAVGTKNKLPVTGLAEVEQPVVVARRLPHEHVFQHLLRDSRRAAVADEVRSKFAVAGTAKGHVVAQDLQAGVRSPQYW